MVGGEVTAMLTWRVIFFCTLLVGHLMAASAQIICS